MTNGNELARRERRAQHGIIEFAEEMQAIRDGQLYPGAGKNSGRTPRNGDAWATYCRERWDMGRSTVDEMILGLPVLRRRCTAGAAGGTTVYSAAAAVATLPEPVQDEVLDHSEKRDEVKAKAKAVRKAQADIRVGEGRDATVEELTQVAKAPPAPPKQPGPDRRSHFVGVLAQAVAFLEDAADYTQANVLSDTENDYAWNRIEKLRYHADRIADRLYRPEHARDIDDEFAKLVEGRQ